eukprot:jgi/Mesvir1/980/Mv17525-RA.2
MMSPGGPGQALYFNHEKADIASFVWKNAPRDNVTIEYWLRLSDAYQTSHTVFSYSVLVSATGNLSRYEEANELAHKLSPRDSLELSRGAIEEAFADNHVGAGMGAYLEWIHIAHTWSTRGGGTTQVYQNGVKVFESSGNGASRPLEPGGHFGFGQRPGQFGDDYDERQALSGLIDEFRIWGTVRSPEDIRATFDTSVDPSTPGLLVYFSFDDVATEGARVPDLTGNGNDATLGSLSLLSNELKYITSRPPTRPTAPRIVTSTAPLKGTSPLRVYFERGAASLAITLPAHQRGATPSSPLTTTVATAPSSGTLRTLQGAPLTQGSIIPDPSPNPFSSSSNNDTKQLVYVPFPSFLSSGADTFAYSVRDTDGNEATVLATVTLRPLSSPPTLLSVATKEDAPVVLVLGGVLGDGSRVPARVASLPNNGRLFAFPGLTPPSSSSNSSSGPGTNVTTTTGSNVTSSPMPGMPRVDYYGDGAASGSLASPTWNLSLLSPILVPNTLVGNPTGSVLFVPSPDEFGAAAGTSEYAGFNFTWQYSNATSGAVALQPSASARVSLFVAPVNDAPRGQAATVVVPRVVAGDVQPGSVGVQLEGVDVDGGLADRPYFRVSSWPRFGQLFQVDGAGQPGDPIPSQGLVPVVSSWVASLLNGSSQSTACPAAASCGAPSTCRVDACGSTRDHLGNIEGEPSRYPQYGEFPDTTRFAAADAPPDGVAEFMEVDFGAPLFLRTVDIYETFKPGAVTRVRAAAEYAGAATNWVTLWQADAGQGEGDGWLLREEAHVFRPPICPLTIQTRYLRVEVGTNLRTGFERFDAIQRHGYLSLPAGLVTDAGGRVRYVARPGLHAYGGSDAVFDAFSFIMSDCRDWGSGDAVVSIKVTAPLPGDGLGSLDQPFNASAGGAYWFRTERQYAALDADNVLTLNTTAVTALADYVAAQGLPDNARLPAAERATATTFLVAQRGQGEARLYHQAPGGGVNRAEGFTAGILSSLDGSGAHSFILTTPSSQGTTFFEAWVLTRSPKSPRSTYYRARLEVTIQCPTGHWNRPSDGVCVLCQDITVAEISMLASVDPERYGQFLGACPTLLLECAAGRYLDEVEFAVSASMERSCKPCPAGTYAPTSSRRVACAPCPPGSFSSSSGAVTCEPCDVLSYQPSPGQRSCGRCPMYTERLITSPGVDVGECLCAARRTGGENGESFPGSWRPDNSSACMLCPKGANCTGPLAGGLGTVAPFPLENFWGMETHPSEFFECRSADLCLGGQNFSCEPGQKGRLCSECDEGYFAVGRKCKECPEKGDGAMTIFGIILVICAWWVLSTISISMFHSLDAAILFLQLLAVISAFKTRWPTAMWPLHQLYSLVNIDVDFVSPGCIATWGYQEGWSTQMLLPVLVLGLLVSIYLLAWIYGALLRIPDDKDEEDASEWKRGGGLVGTGGDAGEHGNHDSGRESVNGNGANASGNSSGKLRGSFKRTWRRQFIWLLSHLGLPEDDRDLQNLQDTLTGRFLNFMVLLYVNLCTRVLETFMCEGLPDGKEFLLAGPALTCWEKGGDGNGGHIANMVFAMICLFTYVLGVPVTLFLIMWWAMRRNQLSNPHFLRTFGWMYTRFDNSYPLWLCVLLVRRLALVLVLVYLQRDGYIQATWGIIVTLACLLLQLLCRPYRTAYNNYLDCATLVVELLYCVAGLLFVSAPHYRHTKALIIFVYMLVFLTLTLAIALFLWKVYHLWAAHRADAVMEMRVGKAMKLIGTSYRAHFKGSLMEAFKATDRDGNGQLDRDELAAILLTIDPNMSEAMIDHTFVLADANGDGKIDFEEFRQHLWHSQQGGQLLDTYGEDMMQRLMEGLQIQEAQLTGKQLRGALESGLTGELSRAIKPQLLRSWALSEKRDPLLVLYYQVDRWLTPYVADESITSTFARSDLAVFYRNLTKAFPFVVDWLATTTERERTMFRDIMESMQDCRAATGNKGYYANVFQSDVRSSVAYWLKDATLEEGYVFVRLCESIIDIGQGTTRAERIATPREEARAFMADDAFERAARWKRVLRETIPWTPRKGRTGSRSPSQRTALSPTSRRVEGLLARTRSGVSGGSPSSPRSPRSPRIRPETPTAAELAREISRNVMRSGLERTLSHSPAHSGPGTPSHAAGHSPPRRQLPPLRTAGSMPSTQRKTGSPGGGASPIRSPGLGEDVPSSHKRAPPGASSTRDGALPSSHKRGGSWGGQSPLGMGLEGGFSGGESPLGVRGEALPPPPPPGDGAGGAGGGEEEGLGSGRESIELEREYTYRKPEGLAPLQTAAASVESPERERERMSPLRYESPYFADRALGRSGSGVSPRSPRSPRDKGRVRFD